MIIKESIFNPLSLEEIKNLVKNPNATFKKSSKGSGNTWRIGYVNTSYKNLLNIFGKPQYLSTSSHSKQNVEWTIEDENGIVYTIYDYKSGLSYDELISLNEFKWHIGGNEKSELNDLIYFILKNSNNKLVKEHASLNESQQYIDEVLRQFIKAMNLIRTNYQILNAEYYGDVIYLEMIIGDKELEIQITNDAIGWSAYINDNIYLGELPDWTNAEFKETIMNYLYES